MRYRHVRYYWYGCHPYIWYGYYPIAREVRSDTSNYYTYNYYGIDGTVVSEPSQTTDYTGLVDHNTFADVREKLAQQTLEQPDEATLADTFFEDAVKAFEVCDYDKAVEMFANASKLAPDDMVLPFAYSQALFAKEQYSQAVEVLRAALRKESPGLTKDSPEKKGPPLREDQGVFYPRGLYPDDDTLFEQIDRLAEKAELYSFDADLQLLLGYQLLGIGEIDEALEPLLRASKDMENADVAAKLLKLLEKIKAENSESENAD
jgi:tetratricopeptide (TPR) repeat protein